MFNTGSDTFLGTILLWRIEEKGVANIFLKRKKNTFLFRSENMLSSVLFYKIFNQYY